MKRDVAIVGAGPAGSTAAILLARGGWDVSLIEQSKFPRDKVCGECLSALGYEVLTRLELAEALRDRDAVRLDHAEVHTRNGRSLRIGLPRPMWGLSRSALDGLLLEAAREAGARLLQPVRCESLDSGPSLRLRNLEDNSVTAISASTVILADGKAAFSTSVPKPTGDFGVKAHFENVDGPRDAIELFAVRESYGGVAAIEEDRWNVAFSVPAHRVKSARGDFDSLFNQWTDENTSFGRRMRGAKRVGRWLASPLPRFSVRENWQPGVIPVGNAAAAVEPIGGEGMGLAMRSAEIGASALLTSTTHALPRRYADLWRTRRLGCRAAALAVSNAPLADALGRPGVPSFALRAAMSLIGK